MQQRIRLHIGTIDFQLMVEREQEHLYREAQQLVNRVFDEYKRAYTNRSIEEIWALTALRVGLNYRQLVEHSDLDPVLEQITQINQQITEVLTATQTQQPSE